jgi:hypothetical protein
MCTFFQAVDGIRPFLGNAFLETCAHLFVFPAKGRPFDAYTTAIDHQDGRRLRCGFQTPLDPY